MSVHQTSDAIGEELVPHVSPTVRFDLGSHHLRKRDKPTSAERYQHQETQRPSFRGLHRENQNDASGKPDGFR